MLDHEYFLVIHRVTCLYYEIMYVVTMKDVQCPIIKMAYMDVIEQ